MKRMSKVIFVVLLLVTIIGSGVLGATIYKTVTATVMPNIKVVVDGVDQIMKDANGDIISPIAVNGSTYLPIRALGEAIGKEVYWDNDSTTVYLGEIPTGALWTEFTQPMALGSAGYNGICYFINDKDLLNQGGKQYSTGLALHHKTGSDVSMVVKTEGYTEIKFKAFLDVGTAKIIISDKDSEAILYEMSIDSLSPVDVKFNLEGTKNLRIKAICSRTATIVLVDPKLK